MPYSVEESLAVSGNQARLRNELNQYFRESSSIRKEVLASPNNEVQGSGGSKCSRCPGYVYHVPEEFRAHSKTDWHQYNLRQSAGTPLAFDEWCSLSHQGDDHSSSDESCSSVEVPVPTFLQVEGVPYSIVPNTTVAIPSVVGDPNAFLEASFISVLLLRAGRFAGAVWSADGNVVAHTSFKRYTVRRKNGGAQSKNDKAKGSPAQSVGAQIRREQEKRLAEDVNEVVTSTWARYSRPKSLVFAYASKSLTDELYLGPLNRAHPACRVVKIPMSVRDPTFAEVCRVYKTLTRFAIVKNLD